MPDLELTTKILDSMSELVAVMHPDQTIRWLNRAASDSAGGESPIGRHCYEVWNGRTTTCPNCPIEVTIREKRESRGTIQTRDGRYWEIRTIPILDETGNLESILEITGEISELKEQEEIVRIVAESASDWVYWYGADDTIRYISPSVERHTGYRREEFMNDPGLLERIVVDDDRAGFRDHMAHFHDGTEHRLAGEFEFRITHSDGTVRWIQHRCEPIISDDGVYLGRHVADREITEQKRIQRERAAFLNQLEALVSGTNHGLILETADRKLVLANEQIRRLFNIPDGAVITGTDTREGIQRSAHLLGDAEDFQQYIESTLEKGDAVFGRKIRLADGSHHEVDFIPVHDNGILTYAFWLYRDVTAQVTMEEEIRRGRNNLENFFQMNRDFLWVLDGSGVILAVNRTVTERLGYSAEELQGQSVLTVHPPERREEAGRIVAAMLQGTAETCPVPIITRKGDQIPVETYVFPGEWNGEPAIFGVSKDISELKLSEEKFSKAFNTSPAIVGLSDMETGEYIDVNQSFYTLLGFKPGEVIGRNASELLKLDPEWRDVVVAKMKDQGYVRNEESVLQTSDGRRLPVLLSAEVISIQDRQYNFTTAIDITELKTALTEKDFLMRELNHRIKNNLAILSSLIDLKNAELGPGVDISDIKNEIHAIRIVHEKLCQSESQQHVEIRDYVQSLLETIFSSGAQQYVAIENEIEEFQVDPTTAINLGLIINELATNAIKHGFREAEPNSFSLSSATDSVNGIVSFVVSNSGQPFPEDKDLESSGTLGLRLVTGLVKQMGGTLELERTPVPVFRFSFPLPSPD